jgi:hypothetical protein
VKALQKRVKVSQQLSSWTPTMQAVLTAHPSQRQAETTKLGQKHARHVPSKRACRLLQAGQRWDSQLRIALFIASRIQ